MIPRVSYTPSVSEGHEVDDVDDDVAVGDDIGDPGPTTVQECEAVEEQVAARLGRQLLLNKSPAPSVRFVIDELAFRRPAAGRRRGTVSLTHIEAIAHWPNVVVQVLPFSAGIHDLMGRGSLTLLWQKDGSAAAYTEGDSGGLLMDDSGDVLRHRLSYDRLRDLALSPSDSLTFIRDVLEEHRS
ncbi:helix-turn-helix transcriptional regulator [Streptomyces hirsutus]